MTKEKVRVGVILSTYNGEKHIEKQLQSIADQTFPNITVFIRDDGSSDQTVQIVRDFITHNPGVKRFVLMDSGGNLGVPACFYEILKKCEEQTFYALCDQDDYWYPEKIDRAVTLLLQDYDPDTPAIYFSRCSYEDENGRVIRTSYHQKLPILLYKVLYHSPASGFTCVFNEALRKKMILDHSPGTEFHDRYLIRGAVCFGKTVYDDSCTAAHIRHAAAVTSGDSDRRSLLRQFVGKEFLGNSAKKEKKDLAFFLQSFQKELSKQDRRLLELFSSDNREMGIWARKVFFPHRLRSSLMGEIALRLLLISKKI